MAVAGKVAITLSTENGGAWSADVTYERLVAVKHNNNLYISRKTVANVEPPNNEFWFLALEGFSGDDVEDIINGSTQVGNAKTLDGHEAEYFAPLTELAKYLKNTGGTVNGNIDQIVSTATILQHKLKNASRNIDIVLYQNGDFAQYDNTNGKRIYSSYANGTNVFNGTASENIKYTDKPTGTYTGNGDATQRTVSIGGVGETLRIVNSALGIAFVTNDGAHCITKDGFLIIPPSECKFANGTLTMATTSSVVNANGYGFSYDLL